MKITQTVLRRPVAVVVLSIAALAMGLFSLSRLDVDYLPEVKYPMVKIHVYWRGATPEEIETNIADPLEQAMATVDNLDYLDSSCIEGMYTLLVNFGYGVNVDIAYQDVLAVMGRVNRKLPPDVDPPLVIKADPSQLPVMEVTVASDKHSLVWIRDWADNWLSDRISSVPGTAGTEVVGGHVREVRVHLDPDRMAAVGLSAEQVAKVLRQENRQLFAGRVTVETREIIARTMGEFESLEEMRQTVVARGANGELVYVRDVAEVVDSHEEVRVITRFNGRPCVKVNVLKQAEANTVRVSRAVEEKLSQLRGEVPDGIEFGVVENQGDYVMGAIRSVRDSALLAAVLVILVVYLFLGHWRQVAVMAIALPLTLLTNFFLMNLMSFSLNVFSLGGLVVALGVILDNSIVVLENVTRLKGETGKGEHAHEGGIVEKATRQVGPAIIASTLTFLGIFLPFLIVPGLASLLFKELVLVVASIVVLSLLVATTVTPFLAERLVLRGGEARGLGWGRGFDRVIERMRNGYGELLGRALRRPLLIVGGAVVLFGAGLYLAERAGSEFLPELDDGRVMVKVKMPAGTSVGETDGVLRVVEKQLEGIPEIESVFAMAGGRVWGLATYEIAQEGEVNIQLVRKADRDISTGDFVEKIKPLVKKAVVPGAKLPVMQMKTKGIRKIGEQSVEVKIQGSDIDDIYGFAQEVASALGRAPGLANVNVSMDMSKPEYRVYVDRARASALDIPVDRVATTLRTLIGGLVSTEFRDGSEYYNIRVMVPEPRLNDKDDIEGLVLEARNGRPIYIRDVAEVRRAVGPVEITRENQIKQVIVRADGAAGISVGEAVARAEAAVADLSSPDGVSFVMGGQAEMMGENQRTMRTILFFAVLFAYVILAIQFNSYLLPVLAMLSIPFALTGSFAALILAGEPIGTTVMIGLVVMMGGIVSQGVVLLSLVEEFRSKGRSAVESVLAAAPLRLRPILMTQLTTMLGLLPLALNLGEGGDMLKPMAVAVIGGLLYSLPLTLFFLPAAYRLVMRGR